MFVFSALGRGKSGPFLTWCVWACVALCFMVLVLPHLGFCVRVECGIAHNGGNSRTRLRNEEGFGWDGFGVARELCVSGCAGS